MSDRSIPRADINLYARLAAAAERLIAVLDALDAPDEDREPEEDFEGDHDGEASLGATADIHQGRAWLATIAEPEAEFDDGESGIGDQDGLAEQTVDEPSLGATEVFDHREGWASSNRIILDGEATETVDDMEVYKPYKRRQIDEDASRAALDSLRRIVARRASC